ncbi:MAG: hypothetical protein KZQ66_03610 [Candidatus Thiodiazotropha sp. (ex Lucinoma aequizonata)]|nr:hypothetical protein [Candidatus Thiodiazotropha sp. (ex Lucinoma aequizonata)]MCU7889912.1 hypothetical protein [Candidatus Thiodiazotropha sp. (ex Lucinoma aequizonata)]MCU7894415.1 hypothetical protein [Candidatus Thiodiazotropha sp. (ex Lucinoma aequizonata)]MCU7899813.1 hypothetical protein [Candidatus Thiodiazotropha sp. (ex Lucinoma aequizonata)]MCU7901203.1 hypothetical protein [Candidatus Thiodiazotropha sp. (ex Lucinoma aequizonata)]
MKIIHRISLSVSKEEQDALSKIGISLDLGFSSFNIEETDEKWPFVEKFVKKYEAVDIISTSFSKADKIQSNYLALRATWHHGYPEPSNEFGFLSEVYNLSDYCSECGAGRIQKKPFKLSGEVKWGNRHIFSLNWIYDEIFVKPEIWEKLFKPFGIGCLEVIDFKSEKKLESVVQVIINNEYSSVSLSDEYPSCVCKKCSVRKFTPIVRNYFPPLNENVCKNIFKTAELFGSGREGHREIVISNELYSVLSKNKIKGFTCYPLLNSV